jgi:hypothetical protein
MRFLAACLIASTAALGCTVNLTQGGSTNIVKNQCTDDSDCGAGACWFGACVAHEGTLTDLLLELAPPVSAPASGIGGLRFLKMEGGLARSNEQHDLDVDSASTVHGYVKSACAFDVTLTPEEQSYGLPVATYVTHTTAVSSTDTGTGASAACVDKLTVSGDTQEFSLDVPPGMFDVYLRPSSTVASDGGIASCAEVPHFFSRVVHAVSGVSCYALPTSAPQALDVRIPWPMDAQPLEGWTLDVLHPTTGQVLSHTAAPLHGVPTAGNAPSSSYTGTWYRVSTSYSQAVGDDTAGQELVRLSPPSTVDGPVVQLSISGLVVSSPAEAAGPQKAIFPKIGPFPDKVHVGGWVWAAADFANNIETPVPSTVTFSASILDMTAPGIFASYSTTVVVGNDGRISAELFPGEYFVREVPSMDPHADAGAEMHLAAQESTWSVSASSSVDQGGKLLLVSPAALLTGRAISALGAGIGGASIQAVAASIDTRRCDGPDAGACAAQPVGVLDTSLAGAAFVPRTAAGVTRGDGKFSLSDVDCGGCDAASSSAAFDLTVEPTDGTRLPWVLRPGISVQQSVDLGELRGTLPILQRGKVEVPSKTSDPLLLRGTLIRAYVIRDQDGAPIFDPTKYPSCVSGKYAGAATVGRCIRSALQVAETHADGDGNYELVLPSSLDATAAQ